jgi:hypothetical protein
MDEDQFGNLGFHGFLRMIAQLHGAPQAPPPTAATSARRRTDPLACVFRALLELNPSKMPNQTWEIIACLNEFVFPFPPLPWAMTELAT